MSGNNSLSVVASSFKSCFFECGREKDGTINNKIKITLFVVALLGLTVAVLATLITTGVLTETCPIYGLGKIGQLGSGVLLTLTFFATIGLGMWVVQAFIERCRQTPTERQIVQDQVEEAEVSNVSTVSSDSTEGQIETGTPPSEVGKSVLLGGNSANIKQPPNVSLNMKKSQSTQKSEVGAPAPGWFSRWFGSSPK